MNREAGSLKGMPSISVVLQATEFDEIVVWELESHDHGDFEILQFWSNPFGFVFSTIDGLELDADTGIVCHRELGDWSICAAERENRFDDSIIVAVCDLELVDDRHGDKEARKNFIWPPPEFRIPAEIIPACPTVLMEVMPKVEGITIKVGIRDSFMVLFFQ